MVSTLIVRSLPCSSFEFMAKEKINIQIGWARSVGKFRSRTMEQAVVVVKVGSIVEIIGRGFLIDDRRQGVIPHVAIGRILKLT